MRIDLFHRIPSIQTPNLYEIHNDDDNNNNNNIIMLSYTYSLPSQNRMLGI